LTSALSYLYSNAVSTGWPTITSFFSINSLSCFLSTILGGLSGGGASAAAYIGLVELLLTVFGIESSSCPLAKYLLAGDCLTVLEQGSPSTCNSYCLLFSCIVKSCIKSREEFCSYFSLISFTCAACYF